MFDQPKSILFSLIGLFFICPFFQACDTTSTDSPETKHYEFTSRTERQQDYNFVVKTSDAQVIETVEAQLAKPKQQRGMHINGKIERGNADYNKDWGWHFVPGKWNLAEYSIEVCDGNPQYVEKNLDYWINNVGRFCPFSSVVLQEVNPQ